MLATRGDVDRARSMFAEALALYETIGMFCYARQARHGLGRLELPQDKFCVVHDRAAPTFQGVRHMVTPL
jgi:hypothetical protein